ncbi:MAG: phosphodiester glycosidase family protein [Anaerolineae bacterium]|nr:phosphodiester glycosidase family protein [Anaerolineae bacterium]
MPVKRKLYQRLHLYTAGICMLVFLACDTGTLPLLSTSTPLPTHTAIATADPLPTPLPSPTPIPIDTGWEPVSTGIETRILDAVTPYGLERVSIVRLNPVAVRFRILYAPGDPRALGTWAFDSGAILVVNGGYFNQGYEALGLVIRGGQASGSSFGDYAGMFAVSQEGVVSVRWLRAWPYNPAEYLAEGIQSFPVLVKPGGVMGFPADGDDGSQARRTVAAQDNTGNILFMVAQRGYFSLHELAVWLSTSDMGIDTALNLDGGPSSGIWMPGQIHVDAIVPVPLVIAVIPL